MILHLKFEDALAVSRGGLYDMIALEVKNPMLFVSKATGVPLSRESRLLKDSMPKQLASDINIKDLESTSDQVYYLLLSMLILMIVWKLYFARRTDDLWTLFFAL